MAKAKEKQQGEVLEVEIIIPQETLTNNPEMQQYYDVESGKLSYDIGENVPKDFKEELDAFLKSSNETELVSFNPIMIALGDLQKLKELQYNPEDETVSVQSFKDGKKYIGSFNTSLTGIKKILKDPHIEYNRKVDAIYNFFKNESDNTKNALEVNFDVHIKKEEAKKKAAEDKKKALELAKIAELAEKNNEQAEKLKAQKAQTRKLEIEANINKISFDASTKSPNLNLEGLTLLKTSLSEKTFESLFTEEDDFNEEQQAIFKNQFDMAFAGAEKIIDSFISNFKLQEDNKALETANTNLTADNKVLEAQTPGAILSGENDMPFASKETVEEEIPANDLAKLVSVVQRLEELQACSNKVNESIKNIVFDDEALNKIKAKITESSMPQVIDWSNKLVDWTNDKLEIYKKHINNQ